MTNICSGAIQTHNILLIYKVLALQTELLRQPSYMCLEQLKAIEG